MRKLIERIQHIQRTKQRKQTVFGGAEWMRQQLLRMTQLNQGLVQMSVGR